MTASRPRRQAGFSLIELLVALVLMGLVSAILSGGLTLVRRGAKASERAVERTDAMIRVDNVLRRQLEHAMRLTWGEPRKRSFVFDGTPDRLSFANVQPDYPVTQGVYFNSFEAVGGGRHVLRYGRQQFDPTLTALPASYPYMTVLAESPATFTFAYYQGGRWRDSWSGMQSMPSLVRLRTTDPGTGSLVWPDIVVRLRVDAEAACVVPGSDALCAQPR